MADENWKWFVGSDEEAFHTECATKDEAIKVALDYGGAYIIEAIPCGELRLSSYFDADYFLDTANDDAYDLANPDGDPLFDATKEQEADLQAMVRDAIDAWQSKHGLKFKGWSFKAQRNLAFITTEGNAK